MSDIHIFADAHSLPWPNAWTAEDLACVQGGDHLAPLDVLLPGGLLVRVLPPVVVTDAAGSFEILRFTTAHATEKGIGRGLVAFASLEDPAPVQPTCRRDVLSGLARALDAALGLEARRTRLLLQAFLRARGDIEIDLSESLSLRLRLPLQDRTVLRLLCGPQGSDILARRLPEPLLARARRLRTPDGHGGLHRPEILPWLPETSAHVLLAAQNDLARLLAGEAA